VFIGSSTGGVDALERVIAPFPADCPPTLIAQHMPAPFLESFARRLDGLSRPASPSRRAGEALRPGGSSCPGGGTHHLTVVGPGGRTACSFPAEEGDLYVPSVDRLFHSAAALGRARSA
jgi:two-component system, chemotaxis family, protein-glutamate methylesterase/glutaminase